MHVRRYEEALAKFDQAIAIKPKSAHAHCLRARALKNLKRDEEAAAEVKTAMACEPKSKHPYLTLAVFNMREKNLSKAREYLAKAEQLEPHNYETAGVTASLLTMEKKYKEAIPYVNEAMKTAPDAFRYAQRAALYRMLGNRKKELEDYNKACAMDPKSALYATERATTFLQTGKLQEGMKEANRAISLDSKYALAYYIRANLEWNLKMPNATLSDLGKAISLEESGTYYHFRGSVYEVKGEWKRALNDQLKADKLIPDQSYIKAAVSRLYHRLLEPKQALVYISAAIKLEPKNAKYYEERSQVYRTMMDYKLSVDDDTKAIEYSKEPPINSLISRIRYYRIEKKFDLALKDQNRIMSYYPGRVSLKEGRAQIYLEKGDYGHSKEDYQRAKEDYDAVIAKFPTDANLNARARANLKLGNLKEALADCNQAIVKQPGMSSYYVLRADIHKAMGKPQESAKDLAAAKAADQAALPPH